VTYSNFSKILMICAVCLISATSCKPPQEKIQFLTWSSDDERSLLQGQLEEFGRRNPQVHIEVILCKNKESCLEEFQNRKANGNIPDVMMISDEEFESFLRQNLLHEFSKQEYPSLESILPELLVFYQNQAGLYAIPIDWSTEVLYYNKTIFDHHKIPMPRPFWDWSDLIAASKALTIETEEGDQAIQWGMDLATTPRQWLPFVLQNCGKMQSSQGEWVLNDPQYIQSNMEAIEFYTDLLREYVARDPKKQSDHAAFLAGKAAMTIDDRSFSKKLGKQTAFEWDICSLPHGRQAATLMNSHALIIFKQTKHLLASMGFVNFLSSEISQSGFGLSGRAPSIKSLLNSPIFLDFPNSLKIQNKYFVESLKFAAPFPRTLAPEETKHILEDELKTLTEHPERGARETIETMQVRLEELTLTHRMK
jgi:multiple sugar transport system substrate-binding protein